jgi:hypothetical protein
MGEGAWGWPLVQDADAPEAAAAATGATKVDGVTPVALATAVDVAEEKEEEKDTGGDTAVASMAETGAVETNDDGGACTSSWS